MVETTRQGYEVIRFYSDPRLVPLRHVTGKVVEWAHPIFESFLNRYEQEVEPIDQYHSWGFAPRRIRGTNTWSEHAAGTAVDVNAPKHPQYRDTFTDHQRASLNLLLKDFPQIEWGGNWPKESLDQMHFELKKGVVGVAGMVSPVKGYKSSDYGRRGSFFHAGTDIATGGVYAPVYAAYAGRASNIVRGRKRYQQANDGTVVASGRSGNGMRINNSDKETQVYIHMTPLASITEGRWIDQGQLIGYVDLSGNTTGLHLHFETWNKHGKTVNPLVHFNYHKVVVGSAPKAAKQPAPTPTDPNAQVASRLASMGLPRTRQGVIRYQEQHGLWPDGLWGNVTERYYQWVRALQNYLNLWKVVQRAGRLVVDGYRGSRTHHAEYLARTHSTRSEPYRPPAEPRKRG